MESAGVFHLCEPKPVVGGVVAFCGESLKFKRNTLFLPSDMVLDELRDDGRVCPWCVLACRPDASMIPDHPSGRIKVRLKSSGQASPRYGSLNYGNDKPH